MNLTAQFVRIDALPDADASAIRSESRCLPPPTGLAPGQSIDGYRLVRALHEGARSTVYLALAPDGAPVALKVPSVDVREAESLLERFAFEEWIARRIASPHVLSAPARAAPRSALYVVTDYLEGGTLRQWMADNPAPGLDAVRDIAAQLVRGLRAMHPPRDGSPGPSPGERDDHPRRDRPDHRPGLDRRRRRRRGRARRARATARNVAVHRARAVVRGTSSAGGPISSRSA